MKKFLKKLQGKLRKFFGGGRFLCDSCLYDYRGACSRPEKPNATECPDYKKR